MLIGRALSGTGGYASNSFLDNEYRTMITFTPSTAQPTYNVEAVSLGSECGIGVMQPSTELARITGNFNVSPIPWIVRSAWHTEIIANSLPNLGQSSPVSKFRVWIEKRILWFIVVELDITNQVYYSPPTLLPWDGAPGGTQNVKKQLGSRFPTIDLSLYPFFSLQLGGTFYPGDFCFVPTVSALDVTTINLSTLNLVYSGGISPTNVARVNNFITQAKISGTNIRNESHFRFNARNAEWIYKQMEQPSNNTMNCPTECTINYGASISGGPICYGSPSMVAIFGNFPSGAIVSWSVGPSNIFAVSSGTGTVANLNLVNSTVSGLASVTFTVTNVCQPIVLSSNFWVGPPAGLIDGPWSVYPDQVYLYSANPLGAPHTFRWSISGSGFNWGWSDTQPQVLVFWSSSGTEGAVGLESSNGCGTTYTSLSITIEVPGGGGGCDPCQIVTPYPNPASKELNVLIVDEKQSKDVKIEGSYEITLINNMSQIVYKTNTTSNQITIPIEGLENGLYFLKVVDNKGTATSRQVQIWK